MSGGHATAAGIIFQQRVATWLAVHVLGEQAFENFGARSTFPQRLYVEADSPVDDIRIVCSDESNLFFNVKTNVARSEQPNSPLGSVIDQFVRQWLSCRDGDGSRGWNKPLNPSRDRLVLATSSTASSSFLSSTTSLLARLRSNGEASRLSDAVTTNEERMTLSAWETQINFAWLRHLGSRPSEAEVWKLLATVWVLVVPAVEEPDTRELSILNQTVSSTAQISSAWKTLFTELGRMAKLRLSADSGSLRELLRTNGCVLNDSPRFLPDIDRLRQVSSDTLQALKRYAQFAAPDAEVPITIRRDCATEIFRHCENESFLLIGQPGAGKSGVIYEVAKHFSEEGHPLLLLAVDEWMAETRQGLQTELGINNLLEEVLAAWESDKQGILIVDALDASRGSRSDKVFHDLLVDIQKLSNWTVLASIRKFDLKYGAQYRTAFRGGPVSEGYRDTDFDNVRHFEIPPLSDSELAQIWRSSRHLETVFASSTQAFRSLLRSPFNMFLLSSVVERHDPTTIAELTTDTQLLYAYWSYRIDAPIDGRRIARERLIRSIAQRMTETRQLFLTKEHLDGLDSEALDQVLASGVLLQHGAFGGRLTFTHHMLFDYAAARTILMVDEAEARPDKLSLSDDVALMLAPAAMMALRLVWLNSPDKNSYWNLAISIAKSSGAGTFSRMLPARIAAELIAQPREVNGLIASLSPLCDDKEPAAFLIRHIFGTLFSGIVFLRPSLGSNEDPWCEICAHLARQNIALMAYPVRAACAQWTEKPEALTTEQAAYLNEASRVLLHHSMTQWFEKDLNDASSISCSIKGTIRTFTANPTESERVLSLLLQPNRVASHGHTDLFNFSSEIGRLIGSAPSLAEQVYRISFCTPLPSANEVSHIGDSRILSLRSNKRQDFQSVQYQLAESFPELLRKHPISGLTTLVEILDDVVPREHQLRLHDVVPVEFDFHDIRARVIEDHSYIWWQPGDHHRNDVSQMLDQFSEALLHWCDEGKLDLIDQIFEEIARDNKWPVLWASVCRAAVERPSVLAIKTLPLLTNSRLLTMLSLSYHLAEVLEKFAPTAERESIYSIEKAIWETGADREHAREVLLGRIPAEKLSMPASLEWKMSRSGSESPARNVPPFQIRVRSGNRGDSSNLDESGETHTSPIEAALKEMELPKEPTNYAIADAIPNWRRVLRVQTLMQDAHDVPQELIETVWDRLAECAEKTALSCKNPGDLKLFPQIEEFIGEALKPQFSPKPLNDRKREQSFARSASWERPAPRIEGAAALMAYARAMSGPMPERLRKTVLALVRDPAVAVRHTIAARVNMIWTADPSLCREVVASVLQNETNAGVLDFFYGALHRVLGNVHELVEKPLLERDALDRESEESTNEESSLTTLIVRFWLDYDSEAARDRLMSWSADPIKYSRKLTTMLGFLRPAVVFGNPQDAGDRNHKMRERTIAIIHSLVTQAAKDFHRLVGLENRNAERQTELENVYRVLDAATHTLYFGSGVRSDEARSLDDVGSDETYMRTQVLQRFLRELGPTMLILTKVPYPAITHYLLETLEGCVAADPEASLKLILETLHNGGPQGGYQFESLGEALLVRLIRLYLADYRALIAQNVEYRTGLVKALDYFATAGWSDARQLVYELPETLR